MFRQQMNDVAKQCVVGMSTTGMRSLNQICANTDYFQIYLANMKWFGQLYLSQHHHNSAQVFPKSTTMHEETLAPVETQEIPPSVVMQIQEIEEPTITCASGITE